MITTIERKILSTKCASLQHFIERLSLESREQRYIPLYYGIGKHHAKCRFEQLSIISSDLDRAKSLECNAEKRLQKLIKKYQEFKTWMKENDNPTP